MTEKPNKNFKGNDSNSKEPDSEKENKREGFDPGIEFEEGQNHSLTFNSDGSVRSYEFPNLNSSYEQRADWFSFGRTNNAQAYITRRSEAIKFSQQLSRYTFIVNRSGTEPDWSNIGPRNINGRVKCLKVHPADPLTVFAGTASGWLWWTQDGGRSWEPFMEEKVIADVGAENFVPSVGSIDLDYNPLTDRLRIIVGTGEGVNTRLSRIFHNFPGNGLLYFDGNNWEHIPFASTGIISDDSSYEPFYTVTKILFGHGSGFDFIVAGLDGLFGVFKFNNGITTEWRWSKLLEGVCTDVVIDLENSDLYACVGEGPNGDQESGEGLFRKRISLDFNQIKIKLKSVSPPGEVDLKWEWGRLALIKENAGIDPKIVLKVGNQVLTLFEESGQTFAIPLLDVSNSRLDGPGGSSFGWCSCVAIKEEQVGSLFTILAGTVNLKKYKGRFHTDTQTGVWEEIPLSAKPIHNDQQMIEFAPSDTNVVYLANDGGIYRSLDTGTDWEKVSNGLIITQFYALGNWYDYGSVMGGGTQDQGSVATNGGQTWRIIDEDTDGGFVLFDSKSPHHIFVERQREIPKRYRNGATDLDDFEEVETFLAALHTPSSCSTDLTNPGNIDENLPWLRVLSQNFNQSQDPNGEYGDSYFTGDKWINRINFKESDKWEAISEFLIEKGFFSAIAVSEQNPEFIYAGTGDLANRVANPSTTKVFFFDKAKSETCRGTWKNIAASPLDKKLDVNQPVTDIVVNPTNPEEIFVSLGFDYDPNILPSGFVYKYKKNDTGDFEWENLSDVASQFPSVSTNALAIHPNHPHLLFAGTDIGVFMLDFNLSTEWFRLGNLLPDTIVTDLKVDVRGNQLIAATFGRGVWKIGLGMQSEVQIYARSNALDIGENFPIPVGVIDPLTNGELVSYMESPDIKVISGSEFQRLKARTYSGFTGTDQIDGIEFDLAIEETSINSGENYHILLQVHNRGKENANNVKVSLFYGKEGILPNDYADLLSPSSNGNWTHLGPIQTIDVLEPYKPFVLEWTWTGPSTDQIEHDFFAIVSEEFDEYDNSILQPKFLAENERKAAMKRIGAKKRSFVPPETTDETMSDNNSFLDFLKKNQGIFYGVILTLLILSFGRYVLYTPCCEDESVAEEGDKGTREEKDPKNDLVGEIGNCEKEKIIVSLKDLTVRCQSGRDCFEKYNDKIGIISHQADYDPIDQGTVDPAYLGYKLCDGTLPGLGCNEPPPDGDQFSSSGADGYDFKNSNPLSSDILQVRAKDPVLFFNPCKKKEKNFVSVCLLNFNLTEEKNKYLNNAPCNKEYIDCRNANLPLICPSGNNDIVQWDNNISANRMTVRTIHSDPEGTRHVIYITLIQTRERDKVFRIAYNSSTFLNGKIQINE